MKKKQKNRFALLAFLLLAAFIFFNWTSILISYHRNKRLSAYNKMMFYETFVLDDFVFYQKKFTKHQNALVKLNYFISKKIPIINAKRPDIFLAGTAISRDFSIEDYFLIAGDNSIKIIAKPEKIQMIEKAFFKQYKKQVLNKTNPLDSVPPPEI